MAGDWLKFETNTPEKPEVLSITIVMGWDDPDLTVGKLLRVWRWFDQHTEEGNAMNVTAALLDRIVGVTGFCGAMAKVGWLEITEGGISLPNFDRHNGKTAKNRSLTAKRVANHKGNAKANATGNAPIVTEALPREEKRREDNNNPPNPPAGGEGAKPEKLKRERKERIQLKTFIEQCRLTNEKPISGYDPLIDYVNETGLPMEFVQLAWEVFKREFIAPGINQKRLQADWRRHFLNYVQKGYYGLWYAKPASDDGAIAYTLSTRGLQEQSVSARREAA